MINYYYNRFKHLRLAQGLVSDINKLNNVLNNFNKKLAIDLLSALTLKYEPELQKIGFYLSGRPIIKGQKQELYREHTNDDLTEDIDYLIMCLCIIGAYRYGVEKSLEIAIENIINN